MIREECGKSDEKSDTGGGESDKGDEESAKGDGESDTGDGESDMGNGDRQEWLDHVGLVGHGEEDGFHSG